MTEGSELEREGSLSTAAGQFVLEEPLANIKTAQVVLPASEKLVTRDAMEGIPVHNKEAGINAVLRMLIANQEHVDNRPSAALETVVLCTVHMVVNSPD